MQEIEVAVIGAGVVGLAVGLELSKVYPDTFILERNSSFGQECSSRNSEVIHAGIYYPKGSLKAQTCVEGKRLLYEFCAEHNIAHRLTGKLIVAVDKNESAELEGLYQSGLVNGAGELRLISRSQIKQLAPAVEAEAALYSPTTGILDSHRFMQELCAQFKAFGGQVAYNSEVVGIEKKKAAFEVALMDQREGMMKFSTRRLVNCAGLNADKVSALIGLAPEEYRLNYCKGSYFRVSPAKARLVNTLVYPVPKGNRAGLGIHATLDLAGGLRLGPDDEYVEEVDYALDPKKQESFYQGVRSFLPFINRDDLSPDMAGIRPKLQGPDEGFRDFIIKDEAEHGLAGFINLIGIESPGLTSALAIARLVKEITLGKG